MKITLPTVEQWKDCIIALLQQDIEFATGSPENRTVTIYSSREKVAGTKITPTRAVEIS